jgi:hypothetical protein
LPEISWKTLNQTSHSLPSRRTSDTQGLWTTINNYFCLKPLYFRENFYAPKDSCNRIHDLFVIWSCESSVLPFGCSSYELPQMWRGPVSVVLSNMGVTGVICWNWPWHGHCWWCLLSLTTWWALLFFLKFQGSKVLCTNMAEQWHANRYFLTEHSHHMCSRLCFVFDINFDNKYSLFFPLRSYKAVRK